MSVTPMKVSIATRETSSRLLDSAIARFDKALVRFDAWFLVFTAVILGLGATIAAGLAIWCVVNQKGRFSGSWSFKDFGLKVNFQCVK